MVEASGLEPLAMELLVSALVGVAVVGSDGVRVVAAVWDSHWDGLSSHPLGASSF